MGKKRAKLVAIDNKKSRSDTFHKRKMGLLKKAAELSILCNVKLLLIFEDLSENVIQFSARNHFDPKVYPTKRIVKLSLEDYPDFFRKQDKHAHKADNSNATEMDDSECINEDCDDASISEESDDHSSDQQPLAQSTNDDFNTNTKVLIKKAQQKLNKVLQNQKGEETEKFIQENTVKGLNIKSEYVPENSSMKIEQDFQDAFARVDPNSVFKKVNDKHPELNRPRNTLEAVPNNQGLEETQKQLIESLTKKMVTDPLSMMANASRMSSMNPLLALMDQRLNLAPLGLPLLGLDPSLMLQRMDPSSIINNLWGNDKKEHLLPNKFMGENNLLNNLGSSKEGFDQSNSWISSYYQNYYKMLDVMTKAVPRSEEATKRNINTNSNDFDLGFDFDSRKKVKK